MADFSAATCAEPPVVAGSVRVQVCYALPDRQFLREVTLVAGSTIGQAIVASGVLQAEALELDTLQVGIYAKKKALDTVLREHDRVELYRPLLADPKHARRRRKPAG
jgi:putative ubiquitin-RnfH superfamily antitoxin RatB of RatAB toxin-antitoxin module